MLITQTSRKVCRVIDEDPFSIEKIEIFLGDSQNESPKPFLNASYALIWVREGSAAVYIDSHELHMAKGMVYFLRPGQYVSLIEHEDIRGNVFSFTREFLSMHEQNSQTLLNHTLFSRLSILPGVVLTAEMADVVDNLADSMMKEYDHHFKSEVLSGILRICVIYLARQFGNADQRHSGSRPAALVDRFYSLLDHDFPTLRTASQYAAALAVTPNYLNQTVKNISGFSVSYHIQQRIILEVKRRAIINDVSMKEIAYALGFYDPAHFSRYFKNITGKKFSDFKKVHRC